MVKQRLESPLSLSEKRRAAGRLGGIQTTLRYGTEQRREWGKFGGRPKLPTLEDLRQKIAPSTKAGEEDVSSTSSLKELKRLFKLRQKSLR